MNEIRSDFFDCIYIALNNGYCFSYYCSKKWRVDDVVADRSGHLYQIQGVRGNEFLVSATGDTTSALSFVSADKLRWHARPSTGERNV